MKGQKYMIAAMTFSMHRLFAAVMSIIAILIVSSCGYRMVGSKVLPFDSITIRPVQNKTYEPRLEERLHNALSDEFIKQGIEVKAAGGDVDLDTQITSFDLAAVGVSDEKVMEQSVEMSVNVKIMDHGSVIEFGSVESLINVTFQTSGSVIESVANKERASDKASREIAKEIVSRIVMRYVN